MAFITIIYYLILEYILIIKLYIEAMFKQTTPIAWQQGTRGDVLLVPGYNVPWSFMEPIANTLNDEGYKIHVISELSHTTLPVLPCTEILHTYIHDHHIKNAIIIAFSKGGLVAKAYIDIYDAADHVKTVISISTPYGGTLWGYLQLFQLGELAPNSELIKKIQENTINNKKIINIYPRVDNHILPNKNAMLSGALVNEEIPIIGHTRILFDKRLIGSIKSYL